MPQIGASVRRSDHPYLVKELTDLPAGLRWLAEPLILPGDAIETIFVVPEQSLDRKYEGALGVRLVPPQVMVFTSTRAVYAQMSFEYGHPGLAISIQSKDLLYAHLSVILLYGRLELCGTSDGDLKRVVLEYNSVSQPVLQPALWRLLRMTWRTDSRDDAAVDHTEQYLEEIFECSLKYRSGIRDFGLQPGERLLGFVYQPPIYRKYLKIFRRKIAPPALLAVSSDQVITIEEGMSNAMSYGWIVSFYPLSCIESANAEQMGQRQEIRFRLSNGKTAIERGVSVEADAAERWQKLWAEYSS